MRLFLYIAVVFLLSACSVFKSGQKLGKTYIRKSGLKYTITKAGEGDKPEKGEKLKVHFVGKLKSGEQFVSTHEKEYPIVFQLGTGQVIPGLDEFFGLVNQGVEATVEIPAKLAYGAKHVGKVLPNSALIYYVEFLEILKPPTPYDVGDKDTLTLESGLKFIKVETTSGRQAMAHHDVELHYTGYLETGNVFDSSVERGFPITFTLAQSQVIKGWDEGIQQMKEGEKFRFIVPPHLAYGENGFPPVISPNTTMVFDIELLEVK